MNKINSAARDHFGIGPKVIERVYTYEGTEYIYRYDPCKKAALGYLEDLSELSPDNFNLLKDIPDEIYSNTSIQLDYLKDIANSKIEPSYMSDPRLFDDRVFSRLEYNFLETIRDTYPDWWTARNGIQSESIVNGLLSSLEGGEDVTSSIISR